MVIQITGHNHWRRRGGGGGGKVTQRGTEGVREIFENSCIKMIIFLATLNVFFFNLFYSPINEGGGGGGGGMAHFALLSYANDSGVAKIF